MLVPLVGAVIAVIRAISAARERAGERPVTPSPHDITIAEPRGHTSATRLPSGAPSHAYSRNTTERIPAG